MDHLPQLQADVDRAARAAADYDVSILAVDKWFAELSDLLDSASEMITVVLRDVLLEVAECHDDVCDEPDCCLCEHLRGGIALVLASHRVDLAAELERQVRYDPRQATRRPRLVHRPEPPADPAGH